MRIALDVSKAADLDGIGTFSRELTRELARASVDGRAKDLEWRLVTFPEAVERGPIARALGELPGSFSWLDTWRPDDVDLLLATSWRVPAVPARMAFVVYDTTFLSHPDCHTLANRLHCLEGTLRAVLHQASLIAISRATANAVGDHFGVRDVAVVHPGYGSVFEPRADAATRVLPTLDGSAELAGYVLSVGSLEPRKNVARLLDAHERLDLATRRRYPLVVTGGPGWHNASLDARLDAQHGDTVHRLGAVDEDRLVDLYSAATVFAYPSLAEGFGLPVVEAMACGAPVVTSDRTSLPEVAGDAARLVDPDDVDALYAALERLLGDPGERQRLSRAGLERCRRFTWTAAADGVLGVIRSLA